MRKLFLVLMLVVMVGGFAGSAQAALVAWSPRGDLANSSAADNEILNTGITALATSIGGTTSTVNGVTFHTGLGAAPGVYASLNGGWAGATGPFSGLTNWSDDLKAVMANGYSTLWNGTGVVGLHNLTIGQEYEVQLLGYTIAGSGRTMEISSGGVSTGQWDAGAASGDSHWYYIATFTADAATQDFDVTGVNSSRAYVSAVNVVVPEPATMIMLGLGSLALLRKRRGVK